MTSYVIIGGGQASLSCASRLRALDADSSITLLCGEPVLPYARPPLSKGYLGGSVDIPQILLRPSDWYAEHDIVVRTNCIATSIDCASRRIVCSDGTEHNYDSLLLATGSRPRLLPFTSERVFALRDLSDADLLSNALRLGDRLVILGGGYIGLEVASVATEHFGMEVTIIEKDSRILSRVACSETADYFVRLHESHGVKFVVSESAEDISDSSDGGCRIRLMGGSTLEADCVLCGIGILPETGLAADSGLSVSDGIEVDSYCRTSDPNIYAAGDCAAFLYDADLTRLESVPHAIHQAETAADNMSGGSTEYIPAPWFWSDQYDTKLQIAGLNRGYDSTYTRATDTGLSVFYYRNDHFLAVDAMNDATTFVAARRLLESNIELPPERVTDSSFDLRSYAKEMLGEGSS